MRPALALALALSCLLVPLPARAQVPLPAPAHRPLPGAFVRDFHAPQPDWRPGHRGVDVAGHPGEVVVSAAAGTVSWAGWIAGRPVVVVDHGEVRTTYEPVTNVVAEGDRVAAGQPLGYLTGGHDGCAAAACLHWGLKRGEEYLDPRLLLGLRSVRLVPSRQRVGFLRAGA